MTDSIAIAVYQNSDDAFLAWRSSGYIPGCCGFFLERNRRRGDEEVIEPVDNYVGFESDVGHSGDHRSSEEWPFQRFNWTDHVVDLGTEVRYRAVAMIVSDDGVLHKGVSSEWSRWATLRGDVGDGFSCFFNRGLVISQFVARYLRDNPQSLPEFKKRLREGADPEFRAFLEGDLGVRLRQLITPSQNGDANLLLALYELDDDQLLTLLEDNAARTQVVLSNGSNKSGDGNSDARERLRAAGAVVFDRLLRSKGLGHNKFLVIRDKTDEPRAVWTGSTNWATTGLCTQVNNGLLIQDPAVAKVFARQWELLRDSSSPKMDPAGFSKQLVTANDSPTTVKVGRATVNVWFTRASSRQDLDELRRLVELAEHSVLFLMFSPGAEGLHLAVAQRARSGDIYARGVVSTLGNTREANDLNVLEIELIDGASSDKVGKYPIVQPQGIEQDLGRWIGEVTRRDFLQIGHAIVHSKLMVIDHSSDHPIVVTGSHNFSAPASEKNDENFVIVRDHPELAAAYAAHVMSVYQHYRYRSYVREKLASGREPWQALQRDDNWMKSRLANKRREIDVWCPTP